MMLMMKNSIKVRGLVCLQVDIQSIVHPLGDIICEVGQNHCHNAETGTKPVKWSVDVYVRT